MGLLFPAEALYCPSNLEFGVCAIYEPSKKDF
jgi:hypothetical protein